MPLEGIGTHEPPISEVCSRLGRASLRTLILVFRHFSGAMPSFCQCGTQTCQTTGCPGSDVGRLPCITSFFFSGIFLGYWMLVDSARTGSLASAESIPSAFRRWRDGGFCFGQIVGLVEGTSRPHTCYCCCCCCRRRATCRTAMLAYCCVTVL
jgi:hypothetical protein